MPKYRRNRIRHLTLNKATENAYHEYVNELNEYNKMIDDSQTLYKDTLNKLQDLDEERVDMIKKALDQFFTTFEDTGTILKDKLEESKTSITLLNPQTDVKIFIDENRSNKEFFKKKEFVSYEYTKKIIQARQERLASEESLGDLIDFNTRRKSSVEQVNISRMHSSSTTGEQEPQSPNDFGKFNTIKF